LFIRQSINQSLIPQRAKYIATAKKIAEKLATTKLAAEEVPALVKEPVSVATPVVALQTGAELYEMQSLLEILVTKERTPPEYWNVEQD